MMLKTCATRAVVIVVLAALPALPGCLCNPAGPSGGPRAPDIPLEELAMVPDEVHAGTLTYSVHAYAWRDFMPICPPDGDPLRALARVSEVDSLDIPSDVHLAYVWVINGAEVWAAAVTEPEQPGWPPYMRVAVVRGGPKWDPWIYVDVVAGLVDGQGTLYLVKDNAVWIEQTE